MTKVKDGTFFPLKGIHPFYINTDFGGFLHSLDGWNILDVTRDQETLKMRVAKGVIVISIGFVSLDRYDVGNPKFSFGDLVSIESDHCILPDGRKCVDIDKNELEKAYAICLKQTDIPPEQDESLFHYEYGGNPSIMIWEAYKSIIGVGVYRDPDQLD